VDEFLKQFGPMIGFGIMVVLLVRNSLPSLATLQSWGSSAAQFVPGLGQSSRATPSAGIDDDTLDFQALKRLQARFERNKCKDGKAAVDTCLSHFFHVEG
jgi:hypothetical protein